MVTQAAAAEGYRSWADEANYNERIAERFAELLDDHFLLANVVELIPTGRTNSETAESDQLAQTLDGLLDVWGDGHVYVMQAPHYVALSRGLPYKSNVVAILHHAVQERSDHPHRKRKAN